MSEMESHVFSRGFAYRISGDEYLILLPNMSRDHAIRFLLEFQCKLKAVNYSQIEKKPTVSIAVCEVGPESLLADREVREKADKSHVFAKHAGRNWIAAFSDDSYEKLEVVKASHPPPEHHGLGGPPVPEGQGEGSQAGVFGPCPDGEPQGRAGGLSGEPGDGQRGARRRARAVGPGSGAANPSQDRGRGLRLGHKGAL